MFNASWFENSEPDGFSVLGMVRRSGNDTAQPWFIPLQQITANGRRNARPHRREKTSWLDRLASLFTRPTPEMDMEDGITLFAGRAADIAGKKVLFDSRSFYKKLALKRLVIKIEITVPGTLNSPAGTALALYLGDATTPHSSVPLSDLVRDQSIVWDALPWRPGKTIRMVAMGAPDVWLSAEGFLTITAFDGVQDRAVQAV